MNFNKAMFIRPEGAKPRSTQTLTYQRLICPVEKAMYGRTPTQWIEIYKKNGGEYTNNDEFRVSRWYAKTLVYLRRIAYGTGVLWLPEGELKINYFFYPHKKVLDTEITSSYI